MGKKSNQLSIQIQCASNLERQGTRFPLLFDAMTSFHYSSCANIINFIIFCLTFCLFHSQHKYIASCRSLYSIAIISCIFILCDSYSYSVYYGHQRQRPFTTFPAINYANGRPSQIHSVVLCVLLLLCSLCCHTTDIRPTLSRPVQ